MHRAYEYLAEAADLGHVKSMEKVAFAYLYGSNVRQNVTMAKMMFEKLSLLGSPRGQLVRFITVTTVALLSILLVCRRQNALEVRQVFLLHTCFLKYLPKPYRLPISACN